MSLWLAIAPLAIVNGALRVDFTVAEFGADALNRLIRAPESLERILG